MTFELRIVRDTDAGARLVRSVPIADPAEAAEARRWVADSEDRWSTLAGGVLRREIVPVGGDAA